jgi:hypothetical protein
MSEFLLVVERLMADGADAAMFVSEDTYKAAMFACVFAEPVHGYVWCGRHGWVRSDEACVCDDCVWEALQAQAQAQIEAEFPHGEFDDGARWREPARALSPLSPGQWASEPCGDPDDWRDRHAPDFDPVPVGRCRCGGLVVTQPGTTRVVCVECGADYPESPGWE